MRLSRWIMAIVLTLGIAGVASSAFAQGRGYGRGGGGGGGGGSGGPGEETIPNSLSVPAILVGEAAVGDFPSITVGELVYPEDPPNIGPIAGFPISPGEFFYVQGLHQWQADAIVAPAGTVDVVAAWGDNLTGEAKLKTSSPIRVEVGLYADQTLPEFAWMTGWEVVKLEPDKLDREAAYGTLATEDMLGMFESNPKLAPEIEVRAYDGDARLTIYNKDTHEMIVDNQEATAEINSTGRIVYGYNLRVPTVGTYVIEFYAPNVYIINGDEADQDHHTISLQITVSQGGGGGGGKGGGRPGGPPGKP